MKYEKQSAKINALSKFHAAAAVNFSECQFTKAQCNCIDVTDHGVQPRWQKIMLSLCQMSLTMDHDKVHLNSQPAIDYKIDTSLEKVV
jgi:hypothetical protein